MICNYYAEPLYFFFSSDVPALLYYSHIPSTIVALLVGFYVYINGRDYILNKLLFLISICFSIWTFGSLISWTNIHSDTILFVWQTFSILYSLITIFSIYFVYVFLQKKDISVFLKSILITLLAPVIIFAPTYLNLGGFNITNCDAFEFEGYLFKSYHTFLSVFAIVWIFVLLIKYYRKADADFRKQILYIGIGIESFLIFFFSTTFVAAYLANIEIIKDSTLEFYGLFGMDIFMIFIAVLIVRFKTFNVSLIAPQAIIVALTILIGAQFTFIKSETNIILNAIALILTGVIGIILIRSVKKEVTLREQIEGLVVDLDDANQHLKVLDKMKSEFVSIASHQLRSPLTAIRGYTSMLAEGSYGKLPLKAQVVIENIEESTKFMVSSVEDYLNVSRIEAGNMKYEFSDFSLKELAEKIVDEMRTVALKKGLVIVFRSDCDGGAIINADIGKTRQVLLNLIDNAMKYTPKGTITVVAHDDLRKKRMRVTIQDTGVGMSKETLNEVFDKFVRAKNANEINVTGTGLGLYVAKKVMTGMNGKVWAESEGEGQGSRFIVEFPLSMR